MDFLEHIHLFVPKHLPGYVNNIDKFKSKGIDQIICISVNDPFVMDAWGKANNVGDKIIMLADPFLNFTKAIGTDVDKSARRSWNKIK